MTEVFNISFQLSYSRSLRSILPLKKKCLEKGKKNVKKGKSKEEKMGMTKEGRTEGKKEGTEEHIWTKLMSYMLRVLSSSCHLQTRILKFYCT